MPENRAAPCRFHVEATMTAPGVVLFRFNERRCPYCTALMDCEFQAPGQGAERLPKAGDWFVCHACACVGVFTDEQQIRRLTLSEARDLPDDVKRTSDTVARFIARQRRGASA